MRSYALYRIASTIHFLLFFFFSILVYDFILPSRLILLIAVLNDAATLVISVDNARINRQPDKWRLGQLIFMSFLLGGLLCAISFAHFLVGRNYFDLDPAVLQTVMYLQISSSPHFVIFSTRLVDPFYKNMPSALFIIAIIGTQIIALFMSVYGVEVLDATAMYFFLSYLLVDGHGES
jgi:H+-transporting ATPase